MTKTQTGASGLSAVDSFFDLHVACFQNRLAELESRASGHAQPGDAGLLHKLTHAIHQALDGCEAIQFRIGEDAGLMDAAKQRFRDAIAPWFDQSWFMERAKVKPRGYAGDFETLSAIYNGQVRSTGLGGYLDAYFLNTDLARAVCTRLQAVHDYLCANVQTGMSLLNVACGPGREYDEEFLAACREIELTCIDTDRDALSCAAARFQEVPEQLVHLKTARHSALRMTSATHNVKLFGRPDLIYSVGLCDYIPDRFLVKILAGWREMLSHRGVCYVAFKDALRYRASEYQWLVDWNFFQRTEAECRDLMFRAGFDDDNMVMRRDATGIILNFIATRTGSGVVPVAVESSRRETERASVT